MTRSSGNNFATFDSDLEKDATLHKDKDSNTEEEEEEESEFHIRGAQGWTYLSLIFSLLDIPRGLRL